MKTAFEVISDFCNIRHMIIFNWFCIFFGEFKLHLISEEELYKEIHDFAVFLQLKIIIQKHLHTPAN